MSSEELEKHNRWALTGRILLAVLLLLLYLPFWTTQNYFSPIDHVNLVFHEGGHILFSLFGEFLMMLGGTLTQLTIPIACAIHFLRRGSTPGFHLMLYWTGENLLNISIYIADARRQELPLVAGGVHDWTYLLEVIGLLPNNERVAGLVFGLGSLVVLYSIFHVIQGVVRTKARSFLW